MHVLTYMITISKLSCTELCHYNVIFWEALHYAICPNKSANMLADIFLTQHVVFGIVLWTVFDNMSDLYSHHFSDLFSKFSLCVGMPVADT